MSVEQIDSIDVALTAMQPAQGLDPKPHGQARRTRSDDQVFGQTKHYGEPTPGKRDRRTDALHHQRGQRERVAEYRPAKASDQP
jgi:hypothetical protein